jgi:hypothetical protein
VKYRDQVVCGIVVAVVAYGVFQGIGAAYYLLAGVLVGNVWEAWGRVRTRHRKRAASVRRPERLAAHRARVPS